MYPCRSVESPVLIVLGVKGIRDPTHLLVVDPLVKCRSNLKRVGVLVSWSVNSLAPAFSPPQSKIKYWVYLQERGRLKTRIFDL